MKRKIIFSLTLLGALVASTTLFSLTPQPGSTIDPCLASPLWALAPNPPPDVVNNANNCRFHQFSWRWFLQLMSPVGPGSNQRNFENTEDYPILGVDPCPNSDPQSLLNDSPLGLGIRTAKPMGPAPFQFFLPERINQAGSHQPLFDQRGNVIYYNVRYTPNECDVNPKNVDAAFPNQLGNTVTEIKTSWREITPIERDRYYSVEATIIDLHGLERNVLLGMVGFHLVKNTPNHPEFIWATFEHKDNAPDCNADSETPIRPWTFVSQECAACLARPDLGNCSDVLNSCAFNIFKGNGTPGQVCRRSANGGGSLENQINVESLNEQLVGPDGFLTRLPVFDPMSVFKNYFLVGTLWIKNPHSTRPPWIQDGSIDLLNSTMETFSQFTLTPGNPSNLSVQNCFTCHNFNGAENSATISHILPIRDALLIVGGSGQD